MLHGMLLLFFVLAVIFDFKEARIPNWLCGVFAFLGVFWHLHSYGIGVALAVGKNALLIFAVMFPFWLWKVIGGGDVKLFLTAALYLGERAFYLVFFSAVGTAVYGIFLMAYRGNFKERMYHFYRYVKEDVIRDGHILYPFDRRSEADCESGGVLVSVGVLAGYVFGRVTGLL